MNLLLIILFLVALVGVIVLAIRRGSVDGGYRRRFENRYRRDASGDGRVEAPVFPPAMVIPIGSDPGSHPSHGHSIDCGAHTAHTDGGAAGCGHGGSS